MDTHSSVRSRPDATAVAAALACTLSPEGIDRRRVAAADVFGRALRVHELEDGVRLEYAGGDEVARQLLDFVLFERHCCAQLSYALRFEPDHETVMLEIDGGERFGAAIRAWVTSAPPPVELTGGHAIRTALGGFGTTDAF